MKIKMALSLFFLTILGCKKSIPPEKSLVVYTHSSFLASYGPGVEIAEKFKKETGIDVQMIDAGDSGLILQRLRLEESTRVDVIVGIDQLSMVDAEKDIEWKKLNMPTLEKHPNFPEGNWGPFIPYDWAPLTFVYKDDRLAGIDSWNDLLEDKWEKKLAIHDPRLSTPGLQLLFAIHEINKKETLAYLKKFKKSVYRVAPSWSSGYSLFQKGKASGVFSYLTSPVYHKINEDNDRYHSVVFEEGHPVQVELVGVPERCVNCEGAKKFAAFLLSAESQKALMLKNIMLPVRAGVVDGTEFAKLPKVKTLPMSSALRFAHDKKSKVGIWLESIKED